MCMLRKNDTLLLRFSTVHSFGHPQRSWNLSFPVKGIPLYVKLQRKEIQLPTLTSHRHENKSCVFTFCLNIEASSGYLGSNPGFPANQLCHLGMGILSGGQLAWGLRLLRIWCVLASCCLTPDHQAVWQSRLPGTAENWKASTRLAGAGIAKLRTGVCLL